MATITSTIGATGRDYSMPQTWEDDIPADVVSAGNIYAGMLYKDAEFVASGPVLVFSPHTCDASNYIVLDCAAGQSFQDHATVRANALKYDPSKGVAFRKDSNYDYVIGIVGGACHYLQVKRIQMKADANSGGIQDVSGGTNNAVFSDMVYFGTRPAVDCSGSGTTVSNVLGIAADGSSSAGSFMAVIGNPVFSYCVALRPTNFTPAGSGFTRVYGSPYLFNCGIFGYSTTVNASFNAGSTYNATNLASGLPGFNNVHNVTYSAVTPFVQADASGSLDLRAIAGTALVGAAFPLGSPANDISKTARSVTAPTIGHWEVVAAGPTGNPWYSYRQQ